MKISSLDQLERSSLGEEAKEQIRKHFAEKPKVNKMRNKLVYASRCCEVPSQVVDRKDKLVRCPNCGKLTIYHFFRSKREFKAFQHLRVMERVGAIKGFQREVPFPVTNEGKQIVYRLDYLVQFPDRIEHWDTKGMRTALYKLKKQLVKEKYGIEIIEK